MKRKFSLLIYLLLIISFWGCIDSGKNAKYQNVQIEFIVWNLKDSVLSSDILNLVKPIGPPNCNGSFVLGYDGAIHFVKIDNDSIKNIDLKGKESFFDKHWFGEPAIDKKSSEIDDYFSDVKLPKGLLQKNTIDETKVQGSLSKFLSHQTDYTGFILTKGKDTTGLNGLKSFNTIDGLKSAITAVSCQKNGKRILIIIPDEATAMPTDTADSIGTPPTDSSKMSTAIKPDTGGVPPGDVTKRLNSYFVKLAAPNITSDETHDVRAKVLALFNSEYADVIPMNDGVPTPIDMTIGQYVKSIGLNHKKTKVYKTLTHNGKITKLYVIEN